MEIPETENIGHKTENTESKKIKFTTHKAKKMNNTDHAKKKKVVNADVKKILFLLRHTPYYS